MVNYYAKQVDSDIYKVNFDTKKFNRINHFRRIDYIYFIDEDGVLTITTSNGEKTYDVHKGDIVLKMYSADEDYNNKEYFIVHNDDIIDYVNRYNAFIEENTNENECCDKVNTKAY